MSTLSTSSSSSKNKKKNGNDEAESKPKENRAVERVKLDLVRQPSATNNDLLVGEEFTTLGVAFAVLQNLPIPKDAGFRDVRDHIKELTKNLKGNRSLAASLLANPETKHLVQKADYFVSYAWVGGFGATIEALAKHFEGKPEPYLWMDVLMVDQHVGEKTGLEFKTWSKTFRDSLKQIGKALLVLTPGEKPVAIGRSWCCFEWVCIKQSGIKFEYCVKPQDVENLITRMENGDVGFSTFNDLFAGINVEKANAFEPSDRAAILQLMRETGIKEVNDIIMFSLKEWLLSVAEKRARLGTKAGTYILNAKAALHSALGEFDLAFPLNEQALASARLVPDGLALVATQLNNLAQLLRDKGDYDAAEKMQREALAIDKKLHGHEHPDVATDLNNLALLLQAKGDYDGAEPLHREALDIRQKTLDRDHPDVAQSLNSLAQLWSAKGDNKAAEPFLREALAIDKKVYYSTSIQR
jgi:hypothetical protein